MSANRGQLFPPRSQSFLREQRELVFAERGIFCDRGCGASDSGSLEGMSTGHGEKQGGTRHPNPKTQEILAMGMEECAPRMA